MMDHVPSWAELRVEVSKLVKSQRRCYENVHEMLDHDIPLLDRKLAAVRNDHAFSTYRVVKPTKNMEIIENKEPTKKVEPIKNIETIRNIEPARDTGLTGINEPARNTVPARNTEPARNAESVRNTEPVGGTEFVGNTEPADFEGTVKNRGPKKKSKPFKNKETIKKDELFRIDTDELEHLKAPPMPLSQYLSINRPRTMINIHHRALSMHDKVQRRKLLATRVIDSFERLRLSSRNSSNIGYKSKQFQSRPPLPSSRGTFNTCNAPQFHVKCKISEDEMRRRTAKTYQKLPEVKEKQKKELTKIMKIENFKKQKEYAKKLLENRRHGRINYPLRTSYEDTSILSSQNDSINSMSGPTSADAYCSDPFY